MRWFMLVLAFCIIRGATSLLAEEPPKDSRVEISGTVVDQQENPVADIPVRYFSHKHQDETKTDADGKFTFQVEPFMLNWCALIADDPVGNRVALTAGEHGEPFSAESSCRIRLQPARDLPIRVLDAEGAPSPATIVSAQYGHWGFFTSLTDEEGRATLRIPQAEVPNVVLAIKPNEGIDYRVVLVHNEGNPQLKNARLAKWFDETPIELRLAPSRTIQIRMVDWQSQPIRGIDLVPWMLSKPGEPERLHCDYLPPLFDTTTGEDGRAVIHGVPTWDDHPVTFFARARDYDELRIDIDFKKPVEEVLEYTMNRLVPVAGRVVSADGMPVANVLVAASGASYTGTRVGGSGKTNDDGKFTMQVAPDSLYSLTVRDNDWASSLAEGIVVRPDQPVTDITITAVPATRVFGRVVGEKDQKPIGDHAVRLWQDARDLSALRDGALPNPSHSLRNIRPGQSYQGRTDQDGRFEFFVGPGSFSISADGTRQRSSIGITQGQDREFNFQIPQFEKIPLKVTVVSGDPPRPQADVSVEGLYHASEFRNDIHARTDKQGVINVERDRVGMTFFAKTEDGILAGITEVNAHDNQQTISIAPVGSARARLVDKTTKAPLARRELQWGRLVYRDEQQTLRQLAFGDMVTTDENGHVEMKGLVVGQEYTIQLRLDEHHWRTVHKFTVVNTKPENLGDVPVSLR